MPHPLFPGRFRNHRSPLATALTTKLLGAFATPNKTETTVLTTNLLGVFGQTGNPEAPVQGLDAEPANGAHHPPQTTFDTHELPLSGRVHGRC